MVKIAKFNEYKNYDEHVKDVDDVKGVDMTIKPDYYFHQSILNCLSSLNDEDIKNGVNKYRMNVESLQSLCMGVGNLTQDYYDDLAAYKKTDEYKESSDGSKDIRLAHKKFELLVREIFSSTVNTQKLKV